VRHCPMHLVTVKVKVDSSLFVKMLCLLNFS
jgi:hypothetical protein